MGANYRKPFLSPAVALAKPQGIRQSFSKSLIKALVKNRTASFSPATDLGRTIAKAVKGSSKSLGPSDLSRAITLGDWGLATQLAKNRPGQASVWSYREGFFDGRMGAEVLPLHEALAANAPYDCVVAIMRAYPKALETPESSYKRLPLHCACRKHASPDVISAVVSQYEAACIIPDLLDRLPMHYALSNGAEQDIVRILMTTDSRAARGVDHRGWTPLFVAVNMGADKDVVKLLLEAYPEVVFHKTNRGHSAKSCIRKCAHEKEIAAMISKTTKQLIKTEMLPSVSRRSLQVYTMELV